VVFGIESVAELGLALGRLSASMLEKSPCGPCTVLGIGELILGLHSSQPKVSKGNWEIN